MWSSSLPTRLPRALRALAHEAVVTEERPHPAANVVIIAARPVLAGHALNVP
jgi:hypothetical protein